MHVSLEASLPPDWSSQFALSPTGDSVVVAHESGASVFGLPSGRRLATTTIAPGWRPVAARYVGAGTTRTWLVPWTADRRTRPRLAGGVARGRPRDPTVARRPPPSRSDGDRAATAHGRPCGSADGSRIVTFDGGAHLRDGVTGAMLATLSESKRDEAVSFLSDGRVVVGAAASRPASRADRRDRSGSSTVTG